MKKIKPPPATEVSPPLLSTLKKYGLTFDTWKAILDAQGGTCTICKKIPSTGRTVVDHEHVKNWKKLPPQERVKFVRGILCWYCNGKFLSRGMTIQKAENIVLYLINYQKRRPVEVPKPPKKVKGK